MMDAEKAGALRRPFPKESIGKLPKGGALLDYVGHAAVTDRLLAVDPEWSWEPMAVSEAGLPCLDNGGNLWIRMTVCGVTRIGVGDGKNAKECISDAIRNAAMRFGVALDLWSKEELVEGHGPASRPAVAPESITQEQSRRMHAGFNDIGVKDRAVRMEYVISVVGHPVASSNDLTRTEAGKVIDAIEADKRQAS